MPAAARVSKIQVCSGFSRFGLAGMSFDCHFLSGPEGMGLDAGV